MGGGGRGGRPPTFFLGGGDKFYTLPMVIVLGKGSM